MNQQGVELKVCGVVQGVGFRPFVHRLASECGFSGTVVNCGDGVVIRLTPPLFHFDRFLKGLMEDLPPLARITSLQEKKVNDFPPAVGFSILPSEKAGSAGTMVPPDVALCDECLQELLDPNDYRFLYPFINCTNCGPRFSILESIPYDRLKTSMKVFPMCERCEQEYHEVTDRRFHAQPNACRQCGPSLSWHDRQGCLLTCDDPIAEAVLALNQGKVVAICGLGGFHLAVDAASEESVTALRDRKGRKAKPLAVMVPDVDTARQLCLLSLSEEELLLSRQRPIVLLQKRQNNGLAPSLAPGIDLLGLMLPYTPFHHLLFRDTRGPRALVMTSGNRSNEPICTANADAVEKLSGIADNFLLHNRDIVTRLDDSVARVICDRPRMMRRSRGFVPEGVVVGQPLPEIISCGAELKNTFCLTRGNEAFVSQHIGDLSSHENLIFFEESVTHLQNVLETKPVAVVCDMHPDYLSSGFARVLGLPIYKVQHHHAHAVAVMVEHGLDDETYAVVLDGVGLGEDGTLWGGEVLQAGLTSYARLASLEQLLLPGGDMAAREPWRMGLAALWQAYGPEEMDKNMPPSLAAVPLYTRTVLTEMMAGRINCPLTSSCGRLFDAVAALLGLRHKCDYEGQAAMELETLARQAMRDGLGEMVKKEEQFSVEIYEEQDRLVIRSSSMIRALLKSLAKGQDPALLSMLFHRWLIASFRSIVEEVGKRLGKKKVVLSGGCLQNAVLLSGLCRELEQVGFVVFSGERVPVNDGGISLGQAVVGGMMLKKR